MPYLNRRTVRSLLARSRPLLSPEASRSTPEAPPEAYAPSVAKNAEPALPEQTTSAPLPLAVSEPAANLTEAAALSPPLPPSGPFNGEAVTAIEDNQSSPASTHSLPVIPAQNEPNTSQNPNPVVTGLPDATQREVPDYWEAGIPLSDSMDTTPDSLRPPALEPHTAESESQPAPAADSPPFRFESLFAVPQPLHGLVQPPTPGAPPPLYQPHASQPEVFPQLPFTPFHRNAMTAREDSVDCELPGDDRFPRYTGSRIVDGSWLGSRFELFTVGGRPFFCPVHLMLRYPHWRLLLNLERPPQGWVLSPSVNATVFALIMEALVSPTGFDGTEPGLNLVKVALAARQAFDWGMEREVAKLVASFRRYVARRVFYRNPHRPDTHGVMDHNYFVYRSEDIFRAWRVLSLAPRALQKCLPPAELVCLYTLAVPRDLWPALTAEFPDEFAGLIDLSARIRAVPEAVDYHDWWLRFFRLAGCLDFDWMADVPNVLNMFFQSHQEAASQAETQQQPQAQDMNSSPVDGLPGVNSGMFAPAETTGNN